MNQNEAASTRADTPDEWKTVAESAVILGISERQARRYAGRMAGHDRREAGHHAGHEAGHFATLVRVSAMHDLRVKAASRAARPDMAPDIRPDTLPPEAGHEAGHKSATPDMRPDARNEVSGVRVLAETEAAFLREALQTERENSQRDREQIAFLRAQVEAANRQAAESAAALREYLKISAKQLSGGETGQIGTGNAGAQDALETAKSGAAGIVSGAQKNTAQRGVKREIRPLWKLLLGLR